MNDKRIILLKEILLADIRDQWTLKEMADEVNLSVSHLRKHFRTITGLSPLQFLRRERLKAARNLLETTHWRVKEIRFEVGINDPAHFTRAFKEMFDSAPSEYRSVFLANSPKRMSALKNNCSRQQIIVFANKKLLTASEIKRII